MAFFVMASPLTSAASGTDLTVTGTITPAACTPTLSTDGTVEYGKIPAGDLKQTSTTVLPRAILQLKVDCEATTSMALRLIDNNPNDDASSNMGLGKTPAGENIGYAAIVFSNTVVDGTQVQMSESADNGQSWRKPLAFFRHWLYAPSKLADHSVPIPSHNYSTDLEITGFIYRADSLTLTEEVPLYGHATIQVEYL